MSDLLEKYMNLGDKEKKSFEKHLTKEEKQELAHELGIMEGLTQSFRQELKSKVSAFEDKSTRAKQMNPAYIGIAASFFLVAFVTVYFLKGNKPVFEEYYELYPNYEVTALRGKEGVSSRQKAYQSYDKGLYEQAYAQFNDLESPVKADYFFSAMSCIELEKYDVAIDNLNHVIVSRDSDYYNAAQWYSALVFIKTEKLDQARELLKVLKESNSEYTNQAQKLFNEL